jgi:hypothetical protein
MCRLPARAPNHLEYIGYAVTFVFIIMSNRLPGLAGIGLRFRLSTAWAFRRNKPVAFLGDRAFYTHLTHLPSDKQILHSPSAEYTITLYAKA